MKIFEFPPTRHIIMTTGAGAPFAAMTCWGKGTTSPLKVWCDIWHKSSRPSWIWICGSRKWNTFSFGLRYEGVWRSRQHLKHIVLFLKLFLNLFFLLCGSIILLKEDGRTQGLHILVSCLPGKMMHAYPTIHGKYVKTLAQTISKEVPVAVQSQCLTWHQVFAFPTLKYRPNVRRVTDQ